MIQRLFGAGLAAFLVLMAGAAVAGPRLERDRCVFKPPRGDRLECYTLIVPENREQPQGAEVRLKVAVLKARRALARDPVIYLAGGPGDSPLVAYNAGADPLAEGDWWNDTANIRRKRDVIIVSERGAGGSAPNLDCFEPRSTEPARAKRRAITEPQERDILLRCRADFDKRKIDLAMFTTPALADDVADLVKAMHLEKVNLYGISYGTRWALEVMRRHPEIVRSVVLDGVYPPQINGEQNEPEIVRGVFEQLYADCAADKLCRERNPNLATVTRTVIANADRNPIEVTLDLDDGARKVKLDSAKLLLILLHMMREGDASMVPETVTALSHGDRRLITQFAETLEDDEGALTEANAQQFGGLFNTIECRESWAAVDQAARDQAIQAGGVYSLSAQMSKLGAYCPVWRVPVAPPAERQPVVSEIPTLLLSGGYDWLTPSSWGREAARHLSLSRHIIFRAQGHGVSAQDQCAARLRDEFFEAPDPRYPPSCRADTPLDFAGAAERVNALP
ncbi:alpha/beta hydrolase fold [Enhydrobacter aerosaccus]|uniref:Alpha/beta hydrolase fold n=1 Tax=Enhydrobacter aerosaccus TaxID=225324 RepID=A0A1T4PWN8_9HYPH|nr:alpha/beta fold hydrolase [Enhydrobacter aerosaccus]SJZ95994.1 alpha/beta hydrolase fold [Enhydrobacter aerosaccus]